MANRDDMRLGADPKAPGERAVTSKLRLLDFDDLFLLSHLLEGHTIAATARYLGLTQPAITQRVRKIEKVFSETILQKVGRHVKLTKVGVAICERAGDALALMQEVSHESMAQPITVGAEPSVGQVLLWPAILSLRQKTEQYLFHHYVGSTAETMALLEAGGIDACLSATAQPIGAFQAIDVREEENFFVASPRVAHNIKSVADLEQLMLIELDRSLPFLRTVGQPGRASLKFKDVWYLGSVATMVQALIAGQGVGIVPESMAKHHMALGRLIPILPELTLAPNHFRLIYRKDRSLESAFLELVRELAEVNLGASS